MIQSRLSVVYNVKDTIIRKQFTTDMKDMQFTSKLSIMSKIQ